MLDQKAAGARHLSKNMHVHHYSEGPAERMNGLLTDYEALSDNASGQQAWLNLKAKAGSRLGQIFNHRETVEFMQALRQFRPHFNEDKILCIPFCVETLHDVNGGVSGC